jgi:hypothetical protein
VQTLGHERVREREQHRGVGVGADRDPLRCNSSRAVVADRADIDHLDAGAGERGEPAAARMLAAAALGDLQVLRVGAAEQHHQAGVARNRWP